MSVEGVQRTLVYTVLSEANPPRTISEICARLDGERDEVERIVGELALRGAVLQEGDFVCVTKKGKKP